MGGRWLHELPDVIADAGLDTSVWPGWETRSRSSGGYDAVWAIGVHHDASPAGTSLEARCAYAWDNSADRPIGALWLHSDGRVVVGAAGATNTQGKGGPYGTSSGVIPLDEGNRYILSIEASNDGTGEVWPTVQQNAYVTLCAALVDWFALDPADVVAHFEWTTRKIDPAGPSRYSPGTGSWDMDAFRWDVDRNTGGTPPPVNRKARDMYNVEVTRNGWPGPVILHIDGDGTRWVQNGHTAQLDQIAGIPLVHIDTTQLTGLLIDRPGVGGHPFGVNSPYRDDQLATAW